MRMTRRRAVQAIAAAPLALAVTAPRAGATDYGSAAEVFSAVDRLAADVAGRLRRLPRVAPGAAGFAESLLADHRRHADDRRRLRRRLRLPPAAAPADTAPSTVDLAALREMQQALVHAHAEGMPAIGDRFAVDVLAHHMVDLSRHLTVMDLWIETESQRG
jgi:hypothetical protein